MKYSILILLSTLFIFAACENNPETNDQTPEAVKQTFQQKYPGENDPDWHTDKNGNFEANFKKKGIKYNADFSPDGQWIETETRVKKKDLPKAVEKAIEKDFDKYKIVEMEKVEHHSKGLFYDIEFKKDGKKMDIEFNADGIRIN